MAEGGLPDFARPLTIQVMRISNYTGFYPQSLKKRGSNSLKTKKTLLGFGYNCINSLHFRELTLKRIFRSKNLIEEKKLEIYNNKFLEAFQKDMKDCKKNKINNAAFYGFILQTNLKKEIIFNNK